MSIAACPSTGSRNVGARRSGDTMIQLDLNDQEREVLIEVLESYLSDLRMEIADTDRMDFRDMLKARKQVLLKVVEMLRPASVARE